MALEDRNFYPAVAVALPAQWGGIRRQSCTASSISSGLVVVILAILSFFGLR